MENKATVQQGTVWFNDRTGKWLTNEYVRTATGRSRNVHKETDDINQALLRKRPPNHLQNKYRPVAVTVTRSVSINGAN